MQTKSSNFDDPEESKEAIEAQDDGKVEQQHLDQSQQQSSKDSTIPIADVSELFMDHDDPGIKALEASLFK